MVDPFLVGSRVTWTKNIPQSWRYIYTPGPMMVISSHWDAGHPSLYSQRFGGIPRQPGWIITVRYKADSTNYYDPPLSLLRGKTRFQIEIHEQWLTQIAGVVL